MPKVKRKDLTETAKELNSELGLDPAINIKDNSDVMRRKIAEAAEHIVPEEDEFSENTWVVLRALELVKDTGGEETQEESEESAAEEAPATEDQPKEEEEGEVPYKVINEEDEEAPTQEKKPKQPNKSDKSNKPSKKSKDSGVERTAFGSKTTSSAAEIDNVLLSTNNPLSIPEIVKRSGCQQNRVASHVRTLVSKDYVEDTGKGADDLGHNSVKRYVRKG